MVVYYGMSDKLPNLSYYDSTGQDYGFSKPYSDERARMIDEEVSRIINEQYERAKDLLRKYAEGHGRLADTLIDREVIFTADVEQIFGARPWTSRTDEILAAQKKDDAPAPAIPDIPATTGDAPSAVSPDEPTEAPQTPPPFKGTN